MNQKIAVLILHGSGTPDRDFAEGLIEQVSNRFAKKVGSVELEFEPVFWSAIFEGEQGRLWEKLKQDGDLDYPRLRRFVIEFLSDAIAYQPTNLGGQNYDRVHELVSESIEKLKDRAGHDAPLCVIAHSLGSIVARNYFYELQSSQQIQIGTSGHVGNIPIGKMRTLTLFYTLGSPMALWSMRYIDFGSPVTVPVPEMEMHYQGLKGEWLNFYDKDDVLAYPLKGLNDAYNRAVTEDVAVNAGGLLTSWNPLSHSKYDTNDQVINRIVDGLERTWRTINEK